MLEIHSEITFSRIDKGRKRQDFMLDSRSICGYEDDEEVKADEGSATKC